MKQEYLLIVENRTIALNETVNRYLTDGWQLYGDPFSDSDARDTRLCQAVIRTTNAPKKK